MWSCMQHGPWGCESFLFCCKEPAVLQSTNRRAQQAVSPLTVVCATLPPQPQNMRSWVGKLSSFESGQNVIHFLSLGRRSRWRSSINQTGWMSGFCSTGQPISCASHLWAEFWLEDLWHSWDNVWKRYKHMSWTCLEILRVFLELREKPSTSCVFYLSYFFRLSVIGETAQSCFCYWWEQPRQLM